MNASRQPLRMRTLAAAMALALAGCAVGPTYQLPDVETPVAFKEGTGEWVKAVPADALERGPWWNLFNDPVLTELASQVEVSNQNVAAAVGAYRQARAIVAEQRAALFPTVDLTFGSTRSGTRGGSTSGGSSSTSTNTGTGTGTGTSSGTGTGTTTTTVSSGGSGSTRNSFQLGIGASWEPDVWGRLGRAVDSARAGEQASAADLQSAKLSAQGELAVDYFNLRELDVQRALQAQTIAGFERTFNIATNRYNAGIVAKTDVLQAQTQLITARGDILGIDRQRAVLEHAIAVLVGRAPSNFAIAPRPVWQGTVPDVPFDVPSTLLQRRPDIAAAERRVAQANEQVGIATAALYPSLRLSASAGLGAARIGELFSASALAWSIGASVAQTLFDAGGNRARVEASRGALEQAAARYRQTVLVAFQNIEDQLVASRILQDQLALRQQAADAANLVEQQVLNRYLAGQVSFTEVVNAQITAQGARRTLVTAQSDRHVAAVSLIQALGGGWRGL